MPHICLTIFTRGHSATYWWQEMTWFILGFAAPSRFDLFVFYWLYFIWIRIMFTPQWCWIINHVGFHQTSAVMMCCTKWWPHSILSVFPGCSSHIHSWYYDLLPIKMFTTLYQSNNNFYNGWGPQCSGWCNVTISRISILLSLWHLSSKNNNSVIMNISGLMVCQHFEF